LVGVITNGTATLGLGKTGPLAAKPVMEGKAVLLKTLAGVDAYDIELDAFDADAFIQCVRAMAPTFGAVNLEDIAAPQCFYIEEQLRKLCDIPIFHDDQHGTAIITGAALLNALELQGKKIEEVRIVFSGAGAAGIACARLYEALGVKHEHITMTDIHGVVYAGREVGMNPYLAYFAQDTPARTLAEAIVGADVFVGLSVGGIVSQDMVKSMAAKPIIFALANPEPEIRYEAVKAVCPDAIVASGRSDYPNQVNNVLCFPFIFRGALDVGARTINQEMEIAACRALAQLAHEEVPEVVKLAYGNAPIRFGPDYIIPKPFDPRALLRVAPAIAEAASKTGVARMPILDMDSYHNRLERLQGASKGFVRQLIQKVQNAPPRRIVFPEGDEDKILQAAQILLDEKIAIPVLMGEESVILARARELDLDLTGAEIFDHMKDPQREEMVRTYHRMRQRKGVTLVEARSILRHREPYGMMLAHTRRVDGIVAGVTKAYRETLSPALEIIGVREPVGRACGVFLVLSKHGGIKFFADTTVNIDPDEHALAEIAIAASNLALSFDIRPRVAMLSYSNFGTSRHPHATRVARATALIKKQRPDLEVDGEMQVDVALDNDLRESRFDFSTLTDEANVFVFPDLNSGNIGYKLLHRMGNAELIGPVLTGMRRPVNVLQLECSVAAIVHLTVITCLQAQRI
jgi:malate dehydrogenase (oxaloacetate-decarboxylating)(NADP+)